MHTTQLMHAGLGVYCFSLACITCQMGRCNVRCVHAKMLPTIGRRKLYEAQKPIFMVPNIVDANITKTIQTSHGL